MSSNIHLQKRITRSLRDAPAVVAEEVLGCRGASQVVVTVLVGEPQVARRSAVACLRITNLEVVRLRDTIDHDGQGGLRGEPRVAVPEQVRARTVDGDVDAPAACERLRQGPVEGHVAGDRRPVVVEIDLPGLRRVGRRDLHADTFHVLADELDAGVVGQGIAVVAIRVDRAVPRRRVHATRRRIAGVGGVGVPVVAHHRGVLHPHLGIARVDGAGVVVVRRHRHVLAGVCRTTVDRADASVIARERRTRDAPGSRVARLGAVACVPIVADDRDVCDRAGLGIARVDGAGVVVVHRIDLLRHALSIDGIAREASAEVPAAVLLDVGDHAGLGIARIDRAVVPVGQDLPARLDAHMFRARHLGDARGGGLAVVVVCAFARLGRHERVLADALQVAGVGGARVAVVALGPLTFRIAVHETREVRQIPGQHVGVEVSVAVDVADVAHAVLVHVLLPRVLEAGAIVLALADGHHQRVSRHRDGGSFVAEAVVVVVGVADVAPIVAVQVRLVGVDVVGAVVDGVQDPVAVDVVVADVSDEIVVQVRLVGVRIGGAVVLARTHLDLTRMGFLPPVLVEPGVAEAVVVVIVVADVSEEIPDHGDVAVGTGQDLVQVRLVGVRIGGAVVDGVQDPVAVAIGVADVAHAVAVGVHLVGVVPPQAVVAVVRDVVTVGVRGLREAEPAVVAGFVIRTRRHEPHGKGTQDAEHPGVVVLQTHLAFLRSVRPLNSSSDTVSQLEGGYRYKICCIYQYLHPSSS